MLETLKSIDATSLDNSPSVAADAVCACNAVISPFVAAISATKAPDTSSTHPSTTPNSVSVSADAVCACILVFSLPVPIISATNAADT